MCFKGFSEDIKAENLLAEVYNLRLEETKKHGDIKLSFKAFTEAN